MKSSHINTRGKILKIGSIIFLLVMTLSAQGGGDFIEGGKFSKERIAIFTRIDQTDVVIKVRNKETYGYAKQLVGSDSFLNSKMTLAICFTTWDAHTKEFPLFAIPDKAQGRVTFYNYLNQGVEILKGPR